MQKRNVSICFMVLAISAIIIWLSGCETIPDMMDSTTSPMVITKEEITVGVVFPMTGRHETSFGYSMHRTLQIVLREVNDSKLTKVKLKFIYEDDQSTVQGAINAYNKLIHEDKVSIILGPATSSATKETFPIAQENQVLAISPTSAARGLSAIGDYVFRIALTSNVLVPNGVEQTHAILGYKKVATLYDETDEFSKDGENAVQEELAAIGVEVLISETFQGDSETDFSDQLTRINELNPDAIFVSSLPGVKSEILLKGQELGITAPFILRTLTDADVEASGEAAEGAITFVGWGSNIDTPGNQAFITEYGNCQPYEDCAVGSPGPKPNNYAARTYAAVHVLAEAIENAVSTNAADIRDALANISDYDTILGKFSFDENGDAVYDPKILIVKNGELVLLE